MRINKAHSNTNAFGHTRIEVIANNNAAEIHGQFGVNIVINRCHRNNSYKTHSAMPTNRSVWSVKRAWSSAFDRHHDKCANWINLLWKLAENIENEFAIYHLNVYRQYSVGYWAMPSILQIIRTFYVFDAHQCKIVDMAKMSTRKLFEDLPILKLRLKKRQLREQKTALKQNNIAKTLEIAPE